jgi:hypothetical protein
MPKSSSWHRRAEGSGAGTATLYAATSSGVYFSRDGTTWTRFNASAVQDGRSEAIDGKERR